MTTTTIKDAFLNSLLARAAYSDLDSSMAAQGVTDALRDPNGQSQMTQSMAKYVTEHYAVSDSSLDSGAGYDVVVFQNKQTLEYTIGNRGTQFGSGVIEDYLKGDSKQFRLFPASHYDRFPALA